MIWLWLGPLCALGYWFAATCTFVWLSHWATARAPSYRYRDTNWGDYYDGFPVIMGTLLWPLIAPVVVVGFLGYWCHRGFVFVAESLHGLTHADR